MTCGKKIKRGIKASTKSSSNSLVFFYLQHTMSRITYLSSSSSSSSDEEELREEEGATSSSDEEELQDEGATEAIERCIKVSCGTRYHYILNMKRMHEYPEVDKVVMFAALCKGHLDVSIFDALKKEISKAMIMTSNLQVYARYVSLHYTKEMYAFLYSILFLKCNAMIEHAKDYGLTVERMHYALENLYIKELTCYVEEENEENTKPMSKKLLLQLRSLYDWKDVATSEGFNFKFCL